MSNDNIEPIGKVEPEEQTFFGSLGFKIGDVFRIRNQYFVINNFVQEYGFMNLKFMSPDQAQKLLPNRPMEDKENAPSTK